MRFDKAYIPYGGYWSTPFCRWQGSFGHLHSLKFGAEVAVRALAQRKVSAEVFDGFCLGLTVPQQFSFYGGPWVAGLIGAPGISGPIISEACATAGRVVSSAAMGVELGTHSCVLNLLCDRTSNSPHIYYPNPLAVGGVGKTEDWVWDNFGRDPFAKNSMVQTAENVAKKAGIDRAIQDEVALMRYQQYQDALKDDSAFLKRFMVLPIEIKDPAGRKVINTVTGDEGVFPSTAEGLARLRPVVEGGTVTFGTQTYPADGSVGLIVTTREKAAEMSRDPNIVVRVISCGQGRADKGFMPTANVPASRQALTRVGVTMNDIRAIKTHNPFAINDIYFAKEMGIDVSIMNRFGSSLVWGHPQAPTGARLIIELIEELVLAGGGYGLFTGCAAGDTAFAVMIKVD